MTTALSSGDPMAGNTYQRKQTLESLVMWPRDNLYEYCVQEKERALRGLKFLETGTVGDYVDGRFVDGKQSLIEANKRLIAEAQSVIDLYES